MRIQERIVLVCGAALTALLGTGLAHPDQATAPTPAPAAKAASAQAAPAPAAVAESLCANCHDEAKVFGKNPHARPFLARVATEPDAACVSCHGDGQKHAEESGEKKWIRGLHGRDGAAFCVTCHNETSMHQSFGMGSVHANSDTVNCLTCHKVHTPDAKAGHLLAKAPGELCATCHMTQSASFQNKPYAHRLDRGGMTCLDCHSPHAVQGQTVKMTTQGELPCMNCHAEKRGPFVFDHVTGEGGTCLSCHQPHGSNNPKMLLWARVDQLCLSCHSQTGGPATLGSQPPSFHDLRSPRYRNCTTCHVAVHGSNLSPQLLK